MSTQELSFGLGDLMITVGPSGYPVRAVRTSDGTDYLRPQATPGMLTIDGAADRWEPAGLVIDSDETEARYSAVAHPELEYAVRNSFTGSWLQRHVLMNTSAAAVRVDRLALPVPVGPGCVGWASAAGGDSAWTVTPSDGTGPVLVGELTQGSVDDWDDDGFLTGELVLPPGRRMVLQWRIEAVEEVSGFARGRRPVLSARTELPATLPYEVADADTAVVVDDPVTVFTEDEVQLITSDRPGRFPVQLRSARGTNRLMLAWVPSFVDLIAEVSGRWLSGRRSSAGVPVLPGSGAALGLQQAVLGGLAVDLDDAEDALALHAARLLERDRLSIMDQAFLAQETVRTGEPEPLDRAREALSRTAALEPGLGLAATRVCLAELASGGSPAELVARLRVLSRAAGTPARRPATAGESHLLAQAARLETLTVTGPADAGVPAAVIPHALAVGAELGSGLPGHRIGSIRPSAAIYAAAVLDLLPESYGPELQRHWGSTPHLVAEQTRTTALAAALWPDGRDAEADELGDVVGWLVLGRPME